jgi:hypothetical protein
MKNQKSEAETRVIYAVEIVPDEKFVNNNDETPISRLGAPIVKKFPHFMGQNFHHCVQKFTPFLSNALSPASRIFHNTERYFTRIGLNMAL